MYVVWHPEVNGRAETVLCDRDGLAVLKCIYWE